MSIIVRPTVAIGFALAVSGCDASPTASDAEVDAPSVQCTRNLATPLPPPHFVEGAASWGKQIYAVMQPNAFFSYDVEANTWTELEPPPPDPEHIRDDTGGVVVIGDTLFYFWEARRTLEGKLASYDLVRRKWTSRTGVGGTLGWRAQMAGAAGNKLVAIENIDITKSTPTYSVCPIHEYDIATDQWSSLVSASPNDQGSTAGALRCPFTYDDHLYLPGGPLPMSIFDLEANSWGPFESPPGPKNGPNTACVADDTMLYIGAGGSTSVQAYNLRSQTWSMKHDLPDYLYMARSAYACDGRVYVFDGDVPRLVLGSGYADQRNRTMRYDPLSDTWDL